MTIAPQPEPIWLSQTDILVRDHWTRKLIDKLLGGPDKIERFPMRGRWMERHVYSLCGSRLPKAHPSLPQPPQSRMRGGRRWGARAKSDSASSRRSMASGGRHSKTHAKRCTASIATPSMSRVPVGTKMKSTISRIGSSDCCTHRGLQSKSSCTMRTIRQSSATAAMALDSGTAAKRVTAAAVPAYTRDPSDVISTHLCLKWIAEHTDGTSRPIWSTSMCRLRANPSLPILMRSQWRSRSL